MFALQSKLCFPILKLLVISNEAIAFDCKAKVGGPQFVPAPHQLDNQQAIEPAIKFQPGEAAAIVAASIPYAARPP